ncbi:MAG: helix-turn-helix transcriptional regulator [Hyphobacterium sp.]|nr:MAG: helix-turn-helix transcriptional regulator [Hyphobacterium sp.]
MWKPVLIYAVLLGLGVFALEWLQYEFLARRFGLEILLTLIALAFAGLGVWLGVTLTRRKPEAAFQVNTAAQQSLGITRRELEILGELCSGGTNKDIARKLGLSPNTVKSHIASLFSKLDVSGRVSAIEKARFLSLVP